ncbi:hypothetical protein J6590_057661 [Homalodisca vitripennis]|nr:hypothetical protein J6590_057661 [Homalodisca vitripennis]
MASGREGFSGRVTSAFPNRRTLIVETCLEFFLLFWAALHLFWCFGFKNDQRGTSGGWLYRLALRSSSSPGQRFTSSGVFGSSTITAEL